MKILVDTQVLKGKHFLVNEKLDEFLGGVSEVKNVIIEMGNHWQGADFKMFNTKLEDFIKQLNEVESSMQFYNDFIKKYNDAVINNDDKYGKQTITLK